MPQPVLMGPPGPKPARHASAVVRPVLAAPPGLVQLRVPVQQQVVAVRQQVVAVQQQVVVAGPRSMAHPLLHRRVRLMPSLQRPRQGRPTISCSIFETACTTLHSR